ncbi:putative ABC transport system permease protein [Enterococcus sp. PF1-24]|uniref:ABC transporter permease n=1 Tax=unclassified Enterococcus TaxID=2608891 RepID=UPI002473DF77|nr:MULTISPECIES: ABC transporter permease [unclassified Enterococcus]MDH6363141.1 putative ABC transport system permease protein [Enterococcus sp. PFB1-1]MDH6400235.1 putative ABC transport system permease protein [Enterococcus sp. PF1-24]
MNFIQRAWASVVRRKGKSTILFLVIFILGNVIAGAIAIQQSTANVEKKVKADLGAVATIEYDWQTEMQEESSDEVVMYENLTEEQINEVGKLPYVKEYDYAIQGYFSVTDLKTVGMPEEEADMYEGIGKMVLANGTNLKEPIPFKEKKVVLTDGRTFTDEEISAKKYVAVVSNSFAQENGLALGDEFIIDSNLDDYKEDGSIEKNKINDFAITVVGLYDPIKLETKTSDDEKNSMNNDPYFDMMQLNTFYMPNSVIKELTNLDLEKIKEIKPELYIKDDGSDFTEEDNFYAIPTYFLKSPEDADAFKEEANNLVPKYQKVVVSTDKFDEVGGSLQKMSKIAGYVVIIAVIAALVIISLVVILFLRDRKHELGIYLSLGEKRKNVLLQVIIELLVISLVAMCLSLVTGNFLGKMVSESLLRSDALATNVSNMNGFYHDPTALMNNISLTAEDVQAAYQVNFSVSYIISFLVVGLLTVLGSAILPLLYILRLNPKKIMM